MIAKVGAIILDESGKLLVARKKVPGRHTFIIPGGRQEAGEDEEQTCRRELLEELNVEVESMRHLGVFEEPAEFEDDTVRISAYLVEVRGNPTPTSEIVELAWVDSRYAEEGYELGTVLTKHIIPQLVREGRVSPRTGEAVPGR